MLVRVCFGNDEGAMNAYINQSRDYVVIVQPGWLAEALDEVENLIRLGSSQIIYLVLTKIDSRSYKSVVNRLESRAESEWHQFSCDRATARKLKYSEEQQVLPAEVTECIMHRRYDQ